MSKIRVPSLTIKVIKAIAEELEYPMDYFQLNFMFRLHKFREFVVSAPRQIGKTHLAVFVLMLYGLMGFVVFILRIVVRLVRKFLIDC